MRIFERYFGKRWNEIKNYSSAQLEQQRIYDDVFKLIRDTGPQDGVQVATKLVRPLEKVLEALAYFESKHIFSKRPDKGRPEPPLKEDMPYGIIRPHELILVKLGLK